MHIACFANFSFGSPCAILVRVATSDLTGRSPRRASLLNGWGKAHFGQSVSRTTDRVEMGAGFSSPPGMLDIRSGHGIQHECERAIARDRTEARNESAAVGDRR